MKKKRILVIDDEAGFTRMLKLNLDQTNRYEVRTVNRPEEALAAAREFRPDLALLDVLMPHLNGWDVAAQFRRDDALKNIPVIFITAAAQKSHLKKPDGTVSDAPFIAKPASFEEVIASLERHLPQ